MSDEPDTPWPFLVGGGLLSALAWVLLANADSSGEAFFGFVAFWCGAVLTIAGAVRLGLPTWMTRHQDRVNGPGERRTPW